MERGGAELKPTFKHKKRRRKKAKVQEGNHLMLSANLCLLKIKRKTRRDTTKVKIKKRKNHKQEAGKEQQRKCTSKLP